MPKQLPFVGRLPGVPPPPFGPAQPAVAVAVHVQRPEARHRKHGGHVERRHPQQMQQLGGSGLDRAFQQDGSETNMRLTGVASESGAGLLGLCLTTDMAGTIAPARSGSSYSVLCEDLDLSSDGGVMPEGFMPEPHGCDSFSCTREPSQCAKGSTLQGR